MEVFTLAGFIAIVKIMIIDILLAGDNAIVIGMAVAKLPDHHRKKAIILGTGGAITVRLIMAFFFVEALAIVPYIHLVGGLLLLWIAHNLLAEDKEEAHKIEAKDNLFAAVKTIVIADTIMGIDNVLGVVAAANGHMMLVLAGMLVTVPIIVWGSTLFAKILERYPIIIYFGGGMLGWVAAGMLSGEPGFGIKAALEPYHYQFSIACALFVLVTSWLEKKFKSKKA